MKYIHEKEVAKVLSMQGLIPVMRQVMIDFSQGQITQPTRHIFEVFSHSGFFGSMSASSRDALGTKLLTFYPNNAEKNMPTHMAEIVLFQPKTGEPMVVMDGRLITEMRTAAVTAAYIDAVTPLKIKTLAILGAGVQGKSHIEALSLVRDFKEIRIWNRTLNRAEKLAKEVGGVVATSCEKAVYNADVVVVATSSNTPVLKGKWLSKGTKVATVGWSDPDKGEVDADVMSNIVIVDSRDGALTESGNIRQHNAHIYAELGEIICGSKVVDKNATVVFDSIGMACQDIAAANLVYEKLKIQSQ